MELAKMLAVTVVAVIGLPLVIVGLALAGPVGLIAAAAVVVIAALAAIIYASRTRNRSDD
jgi:hypothetical protein